MLVLPVAAFRDDQIPAIGFDKFDDIANFHNRILAHLSVEEPIALFLIRGRPTVWLSLSRTDSPGWICKTT